MSVHKPNAKDAIGNGIQTLPFRFKSGIPSSKTIDIPLALKLELTGACRDRVALEASYGIVVIKASTTIAAAAVCVLSSV